MPTMELCVPGGWLRNRSLNLGAKCAIGALPAISCVALGVGAPKTHWSKKMRPTPVSYTHLRAHETDSYL
eukprot:1873464-Pleurochrysis_carterae.AAC.1